MQGEFEKKVQQQMEELNLTPSAPVWEKIEWQIRPEKKRRRVLFWLFFGVLVLGGGWYFLSNRRAESSLASQSNPSKSYVGNQPVSLPEKKGNTSLISADANNKKNVLPENPDTKTLLISVAKPESKKGQTRIKPLTVMGDNRLMEEKSTEPDALPVTARQQPMKNEESDSAGIRTGNATLLQQETKIVVTEQVLKQDSSTRSSLIPTEAASLPSVDSTLKKKLVKLNPEWGKQVLLQIGWSRYSSAFGTYLQPSYSSYNPNTSVSGYAPQASSFSKNIAFSVGFGLTKKLTDRLQLAFGLQYAYYSVRGKLGAFKAVDTSFFYLNNPVSANGYYATGQVTDYNSYFHVLELPMGLDLQLFKSIPLALSAGASYSQLLRSNALTYDLASNIFYRNKQSNNTHYVQVFGGLQYSIVQGPKLKISLGPQVQFNLTGVQKQAAGKAPHLFFAGVKTAFNF